MGSAAGPLVKRPRVAVPRLVDGGSPAAAVHGRRVAVNDPRGILDEFFAVCVGFRGSREARYDGVSALYDPETQRKTYRAKHEERGICRSCTTKAKTGRKYCERHLALANERAVRSLMKRRAA